jgi:tRNA-modifying protein YgfZ
MQDVHLRLGAALAPDGVPLHYGDQAAEFHAALGGAALMDRSHEGRLTLAGRDKLALLHRMSTNDLESLKLGEGRPTLFTNPNARVLDRVTVYSRDDTALLITEPGRGEAVRQYLQRNIFFNDDVRLSDITATTRQFNLHGAQADAAIAAVGVPALPTMQGVEFAIGGVTAFIARNKPLSGAHWTVITENQHAPVVWEALLATGLAQPAGSLAYNVLRISAGRPGVGRELSSEYIPLEIGLWDEVSFHKGCYTGQEIIARMESRGRVARTLIALKLDAPVNAPAPLSSEGREIGTLTSSVTTPDGDHVGLGVVKVAFARVGAALTAGAVPATITRLPGVQPPSLEPE